MYGDHRHHKEDSNKKGILRKAEDGGDIVKRGNGCVEKWLNSVDGPSI